jgi:replicative DNA helicase
VRKDGSIDGASGDHYLLKIIAMVSSTAHIEYHARIILRKYIQRSLIKISPKLPKSVTMKVYGRFDLLDKAESRIIARLLKVTTKLQNCTLDLSQKQTKQHQLQNVMDSSELCLQFTDLDRLTVAGQ